MSELQRLERFGQGLGLSDADEEASAADVEAGSRLVLLRGKAPARVGAYEEFEFATRSAQFCCCRPTSNPFLSGCGR